MSGKQSLADRITAIVRIYHATPADTTDVIGLIGLRKDLTTLLFGFSREMGDLYSEKTGAEFRRKSGEAKKYSAIVAGGESSAKAEKLARAESEELYKEEALADAIYRAAEMIRYQANEVCSCLQQHIANVRQEHRQEMTGTGSQ